MKKIKLFALVLSVIMLASVNFQCQKDNPQPQKEQCEINNTGYVSFRNATSSSINMTLDGVVYTITAGATNGKTVSAGLHTYSAVSADGIHTWSSAQVDVTQCSDTPVEFII